MGKQTALYVAFFSTLAIYIGWKFAFYKGTAAELATRLKQVRNLKDALGRYFATVTLVAVLFAVVLYVVATKRHG